MGVSAGKFTLGLMTGTGERTAGRIPALNWGAAHRVSIQLRYSDLDAMGHVNNARYAEYLEVTRVQMSRDLGLREVDDLSVLARLELDYLGEVKLGQELVIESLVERVGRTSWTVVSRYLADGVPCAFARCVQVSVDGARQPEPLPDWFRERVAPILVSVGASADTVRL